MVTSSTPSTNISLTVDGFYVWYGIEYMSLICELSYIKILKLYRIRIWFVD